MPPARPLRAFNHDMVPVLGAVLRTRWPTTTATPLGATVGPVWAALPGRSAAADAGACAQPIGLVDATTIAIDAVLVALPLSP
jgi:hypothetical protein